MEHQKKIAAKEVHQPAYERQIGRTSYSVHFHFDEESKSTMQEKLVKLFKEELEVKSCKPL